MVEPGDTTVTYVNNKNANRVVVTINGGGDASGRGGGINQISITAGGTTRNITPGPQHGERADVHVDAEPVRRTDHPRRRRVELDR